MSGAVGGEDAQARRLTEVARRRDHPNSRPRDAATLIIVDETGPEPRILMGRRHDRHTFLPGKFVFPGGRIDYADRRLAGGCDFEAATAAKLLIDMKGGADPGRARALGLAALRETFEETGLLVGATGGSIPASRSPAWRAFLVHGVRPSLEGVRFIARAITPPRRPRRYDTRFFCVSRDAVAKTVRLEESELLDLHWIALSQSDTFDLPTITQVILEELAAHLEKGGLPDPSSPVPYYFMHQGRFRRELI